MSARRPLGPRYALSRVAVAGAVVAAVAAVPGAIVAAHAEAAPPPPAQPVLSGVRLLPVAAVLPVAGYRLTGRFGDSSYLWSSRHTGLDFAAPSGTPIRALGRGRVVEAGYDGRYGNRTVLRLADGTEVWLCHQTEILVEAGRQVRAGEVIGTVGSTGNVTGPHLHLEVHPSGGAPVDPEPWLRAHGLRP